MKWVTIKKIMFALVLCSVQCACAMEDGGDTVSLSDARRFVVAREQKRGFIPPLIRLCARSVVVAGDTVAEPPHFLKPMVEVERRFLRTAIRGNSAFESMRHAELDLFDQLSRFGQEECEQLFFDISFITAINKGECTPALARYYLSCGASLDFKRVEALLGTSISLALGPLHRAAGRGLVDVLAVLLQRGGEVDSVAGAEQMTPLHCVAEPHLPMLDAEGEEKRSWSAQERTEFLQTPQVLDALVATTRLLLGQHATVNPLDARGRTPLFLATGDDLVPVVRLLLEHGGDPRIADHNGETVLCNALRDRAYGAVRLLLGRPADEAGQAGAGQALVDINEAGTGQAPFNDTPLRRAIRLKEGRFVALLIAAGASVDADAHLEEVLSRKTDVEIMRQLDAAGAAIAPFARIGLDRALGLLARTTREGRERHRLMQHFFANHREAQARQEAEAREEGGEESGGE